MPWPVPPRTDPPAACNTPLPAAICWVLPMEEALAEFLRHLALEKNASAHTAKSYREDLTQALDFFRQRLASQSPEPGQLSTRVLRAYLAWLHEQGYAKTTVSRRL